MYSDLSMETAVVVQQPNRPLLPASSSLHPDQVSSKSNALINLSGTMTTTNNKLVSFQSVTLTDRENDILPAPEERDGHNQ